MVFTFAVADTVASVLDVAFTVATLSPEAPEAMLTLTHTSVELPEVTVGVVLEANGVVQLESRKLTVNPATEPDDDIAYVSSLKPRFDTVTW